jgi:signal transduction histidine kinase
MLLCIYGNKAMLSLAIRNVIQNAIKFSNGKSVTCCLKLESGAIVVSITDQGIGMGPEVLRNVFEPFFRAHTADEYPGHGIGLYIANKIVCLSGGSIEVTSQPGEGSVFNIIFRQNPSF